MFGFGNRSRRVTRSGGTFGTRNLRNAAIAGLGMLAIRWWKNRQTGARSPVEEGRRDKWGSGDVW